MKTKMYFMNMIALLKIKNKKIIEKAPENKPIGKCYYLPHHPVIRPEKLTAKMKMVHASSKSEGEK